MNWRINESKKILKDFYFIETIKIWKVKELYKFIISIYIRCQKINLHENAWICKMV